MAFQLETVVPWGRRFEEYQAMFALTEADLAGRILGCGDGPASFNAEATAAGVEVESIDPIYEFSAAEIAARVEAVFEDMIGQTASNAADFVWGQGVENIDDLSRLRRTAMERFLADFELGRGEGRYHVGELPGLPFDGGSFDLALCSHLLFLYGEQLSTQFHVDSLVELLRVAGEVRVFPLLELGSVPSRHLGAVVAGLEAQGFRSRIVDVDYQFQRGGDQLLILSST